MIHDVFYILCYPKDSGYVGVDVASGGYPFQAMEPGFIKVWRRKKDAIEYRDKFPKRGFELAEFRIVVTKIKEG